MLTHVCVFILTCLCVRIHAYTCVSVHSHLHMGTCAFMLTHVSLCTHTYPCVGVCAFMLIHVCVCIMICYSQEQLSRRLNLAPGGEDITMVTWEELEQVISVGWRASKGVKQMGTGQRHWVVFQRASLTHTTVSYSGIGPSLITLCIFKTFFQGDIGMSNPNKSLGLGMTTFMLCLPLAIVCCTSFEFKQKHGERSFFRSPPT